MSTPLLTSALASIEAALMRARYDSKGADTLLTQDLTDALSCILQAIQTVQGAREDAHRTAGRVPICTELYDILTPDECTTEELIARHPKLAKAYTRLMRLDANGACCTATDIQDATLHGRLSDSDAERFTNEINEACDAMEREEA